MERLTFNVRVSPHSPVTGGGRRASRHRTLSVRLVRASRRIAGVRERYDWDYVWMLAFTALLFLRPQDHLPALQSMHLAEVTAIFGLGAMAARRLRARQTIARINPEVAGVALLGLVVLLTMPFSFWPGGSLAVFTGIYVKIILIFALMMSTITTPRRLHQMTWVMILASGYIAGRAVNDYLSGVNLVDGDRLAGAVGGMFKNPNDLALNLVTFLAPTLFVVIHERRTSRRLVAVLIAVLMVIATVLTKSRSGFLGLVAMGAVVVYYTARVKPGFVFAVVLAAFMALPAMPSSFWDRMDSIVNPEEDATGSRAARIRLINQAVGVFADNPLTGIGAGQFQNYNAPGTVERWRVTHNVWLQVAAELGVFGLATFAFLVARAYMACFAAQRALLGRGRRPRFAWRSRQGEARSTSAPFGHPADPRSAGERHAPMEQTNRVNDEDRRILEINARSMLAGLVGWTVCAFFASVAFNWTFYYVLALAVAGRELAERLSPRDPVPLGETAPRAPRLVRAPA